jgi:hypothetical protein
MAIRIFEIGSVTEEEIEGVRFALYEDKINFYKTPRGN